MGYLCAHPFAYLRVCWEKGLFEWVLCRIDFIKSFVLFYILAGIRADLHTYVGTLSVYMIYTV